MDFRLGQKKIKEKRMRQILPNGMPNPKGEPLANIENIAKQFPKSSSKTNMEAYMSKDIKQILPMLASNGKPSQIEAALESDDWVAEFKFDGFRYVAQWDSKGAHFTSRKTSVKTGKQVDKSENIPHLTRRIKSLDGTILDGEITVLDDSGNSNSVSRIMGCDPEKAIARQEEEGYVIYRVWDCICFKGLDIEKLPYRKRRKYLVKALTLIELHNSKMYQYVQKSKSYLDKKALLKKVDEKGLEGIILKNRDSEYMQGKRSPHMWLKVKKIQTYDVVITGFEAPDKYSWVKHPSAKQIKSKPEMKWNRERGCHVYKVLNRFYEKKWIGAIAIGVYRGKKMIDVGTVSGMTDKIREQLSKNQAKFTDTALEIKAQEFQDNGFRHGRFVKFRDDKNIKDCTWDNIQTVKPTYK